MSVSSDPPTLLVVTGTGTEVGKTIVTAAVAALASAAGRTVAVLKAAQTGLGPGEPGDVHEVGRLSGVTDLHELARYPEPLAPATAALAMASRSSRSEPTGRVSGLCADRTKPRAWSRRRTL